jgi:hypothetical protein
MKFLVEKIREINLEMHFAFVVYEKHLTMQSDNNLLTYKKKRIYQIHY